MLASAAAGNERRKPRGRRHDQLPREAGKSKHQARPRARRPVEAADRAHDDAGAQGGRLDGDVGRGVAEICDEMHALIGQRHIEPARGAACERLGERIALLAIEQAHAADMRGKIALLHELRNDGLLQRRGLAVDQIARADESVHQGSRHHGVADAQARKQRLVERTDIDHLLGIIEALQGSQRRAGIAKLAGVIILEDEGAALPRPRQQLQAPRHRHRNAGRKLVRGRDEDRARPRRRAPASVDDQALVVDRDRVRPHLGKQQLRVGEGIAGVLDPDLVAWRKQDPDGNVDRLLGAGRDDDLIRLAADRAGHPEIVADVGA